MLDLEEVKDNVKRDTVVEVALASKDLGSFQLNIDYSVVCSRWRRLVINGRQTNSQTCLLPFHVYCVVKNHYLLYAPASIITLLVSVLSRVCQNCRTS